MRKNPTASNWKEALLYHSSALYHLRSTLPDIKNIKRRTVFETVKFTVLFSSEAIGFWLNCVGNPTAYVLSLTRLAECNNTLGYGHLRNCDFIRLWWFAFRFLEFSEYHNFWIFLNWKKFFLIKLFTRFIIQSLFSVLNWKNVPHLSLSIINNAEWNTQNIIYFHRVNAATILIFDVSIFSIERMKGLLMSYLWNYKK